MNFSNILLPYDSSEHSVNAAKYALDLAKRYEAHVTIIHCYEEWESGVTEIPEYLLDEIKANRKKEAEDLLKTAGNMFANQGVEFTLKTFNGEPGHILTNLSESKKYDLIIMGSHGHSDIAGLFLGSVTHKVLNTIYCPVLVVP